MLTFKNSKILVIATLASTLAVSCSQINDTTQHQVLSESNNYDSNTPLPITHFPTTLPDDCLDGNAKLYDECGDQVDILNSAIAQAQKESKNVLIVYGGEWCIWCHVIDNYFKGQFRTFDYEWRYADGDIQTWAMREKVTPKDISDAKALNKYVANNFVVAHIDGSYANGDEAIATTGYDISQLYYAPIVLVLDNKGKYAGTMPSSDAIEGFEIRESGGEEFRGYNREILLEQLKLLKAKAS